jgi:hypothetical protein
MISFLNEDVRTRFHCLPIERQRDWETLGAVYEHKGFRLVITFIESEKDWLEVSVRIDKQFDHRSV